MKPSTKWFFFICVYVMLFVFLANSIQDINYYELGINDWLILSFLFLPLILTGASKVGTIRNLTGRPYGKKYSFYELKTALADTDLGIWELDMNKGNLNVNKRWACMLGYDLEEIKPHISFWNKLTHPDDWKNLFFNSNHEIKGFNGNFQHEIRMQTKHGVWKWIAVNGTVIRHDSQGSPVKIIGTQLDIDHIKKAENEIAHSEHKFKTLFHSANDSIFIQDMDMIILDMNNAACKCLGYNRKELLGKKLLEITSPEFLSKEQEMQRELLKNRYSVYETSYICNDGVILPVEVSSRIIYYENSQTILSIAKDISRRKRVESALNESENKFQYIFNNVNDEIFMQDMNYNLLEVNQIACQRLGYTKEELLKLRPEDIETPDNSPLIKSRMTAISHFKHGIFESEHLRIDGTTYPVELSISIVELDGKKRVLTIARDITERKEAEAAVRKHEIEKEMILDGMEEHVVYHDIDMNILWANKAGCEFFNRERSTIIGKPCHEIWPVGIESNGKDSSIKANIQGIPREIERSTPDGRIWSVKSYPLKEPHGDINGGIMITLDITERKKAQEQIQKFNRELLKINEELQSVDRIKNEFLANLGHELRTPLSSIIGYSELLDSLTLGELNDVQKKASESIYRNAERLRSLIDSLLYLSYVNSGKIEYNFELMHIGSAIDEALARVAGELEDKSITVDKKISNQISFMKGEPAKIQELLHNILDNAIKFSNKNGKIEIDVHLEGENLLIEISDNGIGIPHDEVNNLFTLFHQVDGSMKRRHGGTGVGLYICKNIVAAHNGMIWIVSKEGKGTTVHISLPLKWKAADRKEYIDLTDN
ncbi:PAS domain S-box protein [uncultured Methanomethylovorans sp.]|uniref:PAS domain-containing sensor histidine kinase n=1 Tax=uncultured Methanomethylovorans sp. TaxID=183759 RepID=UPI002AA8BAE2|nr:PAS domain S-box protein [uncultured Methanomethylovorans sp.]